MSKAKRIREEIELEESAMEDLELAMAEDARWQRIEAAAVAIASNANPGGVAVNAGLFVTAAEALINEIDRRRNYA